MKKWQRLQIGAILKSDGRYFEINHQFDGSDYKICEVEDDFEMGIDDKIIKGLEDGSWHN